MQLNSPPGYLEPGSARAAAHRDAAAAAGRGAVVDGLERGGRVGRRVLAVTRCLAPPPLLDAVAGGARPGALEEGHCKEDMQLTD